MSHELDSALRTLAYVCALAVYFKFIMPHVVHVIDEVRAFVRTLRARYVGWELDREERQLVEGGQYIYAIKAVRTRLGLGLKEAKDKVDAYKAARGLA